MTSEERQKNEESTDRKMLNENEMNTGMDNKTSTGRESSIWLIQPEMTGTTRWSGGTTTQLAIWPPESSYADRTFLWRLSSAVVEDETSVFTPLPDYNRIILMQDSAVTLTHRKEAAETGQADSICLVPWQVHAFDGADETVSVGKAKDFNLMLRKGAAWGSVTVMMTVPDQPFTLDFVRTFPEMSHFAHDKAFFLAVCCSEDDMVLTSWDGNETCEPSIVKSGGMLLRRATLDELSVGGYAVRPAHRAAHMIVSAIRA